MKKILAMLLCICMLFATESTIVLVDAVENLLGDDIASLLSEELLADYYGDIVIVYKYDPSNTALGSESELPEATNIVLSSEEDFNAEFVTRSLVGYEASYITDAEGKKLSLDANGEGVGLTDGRITFKNVKVDRSVQAFYYVYYTAIDVNYTVRYYFQNANNDDYTEIPALMQSGNAKTGTVFADEELASLIEDNSNLPTNFANGYKLLHAIPDMVAADGSTVFQVYFDREYYSVNFNLDGGYGVDPIYDKYGANITIGIPTKPGYTFNGWYELTVDTDSDGVPDDTSATATLIEPADMPRTIGVKSRYFRADWSAIEGGTKYTVIYWAKESDGTQYILDSQIISGATAGDIVSGNGVTCGKVEHIHDVNCSSCGHEHTVDDCLPDAAHSQSPSTFDLQLYRDLDSNFETGDIYVTRTSNSGETRWYYLYFEGFWYYLGEYYGVNTSWVQGDLIATNNMYLNYRTYYGEKYAAVLKCGHYHDNTCVNTCGLEEHTHNNDCTPIDEPYLSYDDSITDKNVVVEGDGTTVVNVYYHHKTYTLRFFYARSDTSGNNYEVVGGSTYYFGQLANSYDANDAWESVPTLLKNQGAWGRVSEPKLKETYANNSDLISNYSLATNKYIEANGYRYHYFEFTAPYGSDISKVWPVDVFESVSLEAEHSTFHGIGENTYCSYGDVAYFSAWNGQKGVKYSTDNGNQTIKGAYQFLDENLIFDTSIPGYADDTIVSYLCFWVNGNDTKWSIPREFAYDIYTQVDKATQNELDAAAPDDSKYTIDNRTYVKYEDVWYLLFEEFSVFDNSAKEEHNNQTKITLEGYSFYYLDYDNATRKNKDGIDVYDYYFYYKIVSHTDVTFYNEGEAIFTVVDGTFGTLLTDYLGSFNPDLSENLSAYYPATLESNAYYFKGWCNTAECTDDTMIDIDTFTVPDDEHYNLYAYWAKNEYSVKFYNSLGGTQLYEFSGDHSITHGDVIGDTADNSGNTVTSPTKDNDAFLGWFYMDGATRKKFDPQQTPIKGNLEIFAMWEGTAPREYTVRYVFKNGNEEIEIAPATTGVARQNSTKTFTAKAGTELNSGYQTNYYPTTQSHSIVIDEDVNNNVYTFEYYHVDTELSYKVRYVDAATGLNLPINDAEKGIANGEATIETNSSYVLESYVPYNDGTYYYTPDSYKKSLVLSVMQDDQGNYVNDVDSNVIVFEYTKQDKPTGYYIVNYYLENLGNTEGTLTSSNCKLETSVEGAVEYTSYYGEYIPSEIEVDLPSFTGFSLKSHSGSTISFKVLAEGTEINVFYERNSYDYTVNILYEVNNSTKTKKLHSGSAEYGATVSYGLTDADKKLIEGYRPINTTASIVISTDNNVISFYYEPIQYSIVYVPVSFADDEKLSSGATGGYTTPASENKAYSSGEQTFSGSTAVEFTYFEFVGWYTDSDCTNPVDSNCVDENNKFVPKVSDLSETETSHFYAKFVRKTADLTITRVNAAEDQVFVYRITRLDSNGNEDLSTTFRVTLKGNSSVTVKDMLQGKYIITQENEWSWRYADEAQEVDIKATATVTFDDKSNREDWLNGNSGYAEEAAATAEE